MLGGLVCATSIIRINEIFTTNYSKRDLTWDAYGINVWSTVESCCSIVGVCLPTMRPLIARAKRLTSTSKSQKDSRQTGGPTTVVDSDIGSPRSPKVPFWNPPPPVSPRGKGPYQSLGEREDDLERGPDTYPMRNMAEVVSQDPHGPPRTITLNRGDRSPHPVLKSPCYQQEMVFAPPPSPKYPRRT